MQSKPKKPSQNSNTPKTAGSVKLPKPNKGQEVQLGYRLSFSHSHTQPKRSA